MLHRKGVNLANELLRHLVLELLNSCACCALFFARVETPCVQRLHRSSYASKESYNPVAVEEETPSNETENQNTNPQTKQQPNQNKPKKQPPKKNNCTWCATRAAKSAKLREGETGAMNSAFALSTSSPQGVVDQHTSDSSTPLIGDHFSRSVMLVERDHFGQAPCCEN